MKIAIKLFFFSIFISCFNLSAQSLTFDKPFLKSSCEFVEQLTDGSYIIAGRNDSNIVITSLDNKGEIKWSKSFLGYSFRTSFGFKVLDDNNFLFAANIKELNRKVGVIFKIDNLGNIVSEKFVRDSSYNFTSVQITKNIGGNIYFLSIYDRSPGIITPRLFITKLDLNLNQSWSKTFSLVISGINSYFFTETSDSNIYLSRNDKNTVYKFDMDGNLIWTKTFGTKINNFLSVENDDMIIIENSAIIKINKDGVIKWSQPLSTIVSGCISNGGYIFVGNYYFTKFDFNGNMVISKPFSFNSEKIISTSDGGIFLAGNLLIKTNSQYKFIHLRSPRGLENINYYKSQGYNIKYDLFGIQNFFIEFTTNSGITWNVIADSYYDTTGSIIWNIPFVGSKNCKVRVSDIFNTISSFSDTTFTIDTVMFGGNGVYDFININSIKMWFNNIGFGSDDNGYSNGFYWPGGGYPYISATFVDGFLFGGKVNGQIRIGGTNYRTSLQAGKILSNGLPDTPYHSKYRIYKIRKDWEMLPPGPIRERYSLDYYNWPVDQGAPFDDINNNGTYEPNIDKPKFVGDETCFYVSNDLNYNPNSWLYGTEPVGLEIQSTTYGFNKNDEFADVVFRKFKVINKSNTNFQDIYFSYFSDDDLGFAGDDYVGFDTNANMAYTYNSTNSDQIYGSPVPAVCHQFIQTPIVPSVPTDSARFGDGWKKGYKNLKINSTMPLTKTGPPFQDPMTAEGMYNFMLGFDRDGLEIRDPHTAKVTKFPLSGDPYLGKGWYEGPGWPNGPSASDRRLMITSGSFNMAPSDTQEIVIAIFMAKGTTNLQSVQELKRKAEKYWAFHNKQIISSVKEVNNNIPKEFSLSQNYPNPFNPTTIINYEIPLNPLTAKAGSTTLQNRESGAGGFVSFKIYDILGKEIETLVNEPQAPGKYSVEWNGSKYPSGIYFFKLTAGKYQKIIKGMLLK